MANLTVIDTEPTAFLRSGGGDQSLTPSKSVEQALTKLFRGHSAAVRKNQQEEKEALEQRNWDADYMHEENVRIFNAVGDYSLFQPANLSPADWKEYKFRNFGINTDTKVPVPFPIIQLKARDLVQSSVVHLQNHKLATGVPAIYTLLQISTTYVMPSRIDLIDAMRENGGPNCAYYILLSAHNTNVDRDMFLLDDDDILATAATISAGNTNPHQELPVLVRYNLNSTQLTNSHGLGAGKVTPDPGLRVYSICIRGGVPTFTKRNYFLRFSLREGRHLNVSVVGGGVLDTNL